MKYIVISLLGLLGIVFLNENNIAFGMKLGESDGVIAYSSHNKETSHCYELDSTYYNGIYSGLKWQCVEFARRYLMAVHNITFDMVDFAYQIFDLPYFVSLSDGNKITINKKINNGRSLPKKGALIIWNRHVTPHNTGHVAVVVGITQNHIFIAEQNWENNSWNNKNYSRKLSIRSTDNRIDDPNIIGWIEFTKN
jgi:glutathionylspermidine amidase/synthetase